MDPKLRKYLIEENEERKKKWTYLTEGLDDQMRLQMEVLLNQQEANDRALMEATTSMAAQVGTVIPGSLGLVRRVFPKLTAQQLLSVQPSDRPDGRVFYLDFKFGTTKGAVTAGDRVDQAGRDAKDYSTRTLETDTVMDIYFDIDSILITAIEKALKAKWTMRAQQDLQAYRGLNAETELMGVLGNQIIREIDVLLIDMMAAGATAGNVNWSINAPNAAPWTNIDPKIYKATLYDAMVDANNLIYKKRYRDAVWAVADPDTCTRLEKLEGFKLAEGVDPMEKTIGVILFGTLKNRWTIYKNPWYAANEILMGYKGNDWFETGAVYMPYIPFWATPTLYDPDDFTPRKGVMSRFGKSVVVGDCYATVTLVSS